LVFTTQPADVPEGNTLATVVVTAADAGGNPVTTLSGTVDFSVTACSSSVALGSVALVSGVATLSNSSQRFYTIASGKQIAASIGSLSGNSAGFNVVANSDLPFADGFESCRP
jgi:hypothetical protein